MTTSKSNLSTTPTRSRARLLRFAPGAALATASLACLAAVIALILGPGARYAAIFPPPWLGLVGATLTAAALLLRSRSRGRQAQCCAWAATVTLLGASGGVVLDTFRAFFAVTGIPAGAFSAVDVPGFAARVSALLAAFAALTLSRRIRAEHPHRIHPASAGRRTGLLIVGLGLCLPYPLLKVVWWSDGVVDAGFPTMEIALFGIAALGLVILTTGPGRYVPRWLRSLGGWTASFVLLSMGGLMVFGLLAQVTHVAAASVAFEGAGRSAIVFAVYSTWLLLGVVIAAATVLDEEREASFADLVTLAD